MVIRGIIMEQPQYRLEGIVHTRNAGNEDFEGPLDVIFLLLSKNFATTMTLAIISNISDNQQIVTLNMLSNNKT